MSKGSQNKFLPIFFGVVGAGALGLGYLAYSASDNASIEEAAYTKAKKELNELESAPLSRTEENAKKKKELVDKYLAQVADLNGTLRKYQAAPTDAPDPQAFQKKLQKYVADINKAAKDKSVTLPDKFDYGMGKYLSDFAPDGNVAQALSANLEALNFIASAALESGVRSVDYFSRDEIAIEKEAPAPAPSGTGPKKATPAKKPDAKQAAKATPSVLDESKVLERQSVRMTVTGKNKSVTALLEALANTNPEKAPHFVTIRNLRIENEVKTGTSRTLEVKAEEIKPEGQPPYIVDAVYVLGNQAIKAYLDIDIIRFLDEEAPAKPGDSKPGETKPGAAKPTAKTSN